MSNLFKYTKRVLTSVLAAAVVLTAIPSTAFGAEVDGDVAIDVLETEVAEAGEEVVVENEDALTTDGASSDEEVIVEGEDEDPDKSYSDVEFQLNLTTAHTAANAGTTKHIYYASATSGDTPAEIDLSTLAPPATTNTRKYSGAESTTLGYVSADSENDYSFYVAVDEGFVFDDKPITFKYYDLSNLNHGADGASIAAAEQELDTPSASTFTVEPAGDTFILVTVKSDLMKKVVSGSFYKDYDATDTTAKNYKIHSQLYVKTAEAKAIKDREIPMANITTANIERAYETITATKRTPKYVVDGTAKWKWADLGDFVKGKTLTNDMITLTVTATGKNPVTYKAINSASVTSSDPVGYSGKDLYIHEDLVNAFVYGECDFALAIDGKSADTSIKNVTVKSNSYATVYKTTTTDPVDPTFDYKAALKFDVKVAEDGTTGRTIKDIIVTENNDKTVLKLSDGVAATLSSDGGDATGGKAVITLGASKVDDDITVEVVTQELVTATVTGGGAVYATDGTAGVTAVESGKDLEFEVRPDAGKIVSSVKYHYVTGDDTQDHELTLTSNNVYKITGVDKKIFVDATVEAGGTGRAIDAQIDATVRADGDSDWTGTEITKVCTGTGASGTAFAQTPSGTPAATTRTKWSIGKTAITGKPYYFTVVTSGSGFCATAKYRFGTTGDFTDAIPVGLAAANTYVFRTANVSGSVVDLVVGTAAVVKMNAVANTRVDVNFEAGDLISTAENNYFVITPKASTNSTIKIEKVEAGDGVNSAVTLSSTSQGYMLDKTDLATLTSAGANGVTLTVTTTETVTSGYRAQFDLTAETAAAQTGDPYKHPRLINTVVDKKITAQRLALILGEKTTDTVSSGNLTATFIEEGRVEKNIATAVSLIAAKEGDPGFYPSTKGKPGKEEIVTLAAGVVVTGKNVGNDTLTYTYKTTPSNGNTMVYTATLPVEVKAPYTNLELRSLDKNGVATDAILADKAGTDATFTNKTAQFVVYGKNSRTEEVEQIKNSAKIAIDWEFNPSTKDAGTRTHKMFDAATSNFKSADGNATSVLTGKDSIYVRANTELASVVVKATATFDGDTENAVSVTKGIKVLADNTFYADDAIAISNGPTTESLSPAVPASNKLELSDKGQKTATITYDVYKNIAETAPSISSVTDLKDALKAGNIERVPASSIKYGFTLTSSLDTPAKKDTNEYVKVTNNNDGTFTVTANKVTGSVSGVPVTANLVVSASIDGAVVASTNAIKWTVNNAFPTSEVTLLLDDAAVTEDDGTTVVQQAITGSKYTSRPMSIVETNNNVGTVASTDRGVKFTEESITGAFVLPTQSDFDNTKLGKNRILLGWTNTNDATFAGFYYPGETVYVSGTVADDTYEAVWAGRYEFADAVAAGDDKGKGLALYNGNLANKNDTDDKDKITSYDAFAKMTSPTTAGTPKGTIAGGGSVPLVLVFNETTPYSEDGKAKVAAAETMSDSFVLADVLADSGMVVPKFVTSEMTVELDSVGAELITKSGNVISVPANTDTATNVKVTASWTAEGTTFTTVPVLVDVVASSGYDLKINDGKAAKMLVDQATNNTLAAVFKDKNGAIADTDYKNYVWTWTSSDENVVTVKGVTTDKYQNTATVTPVGIGTATITLSVKDKMGVETTATCALTVESNGVTITLKDENGEAVAAGAPIFALAKGTSANYTLDASKPITPTTVVGDTVIVKTGTNTKMLAGNKIQIETNDKDLSDEGYVLVSYTINGGDGTVFTKKIPVSTYFKINLEATGLSVAADDEVFLTKNSEKVYAPGSTTARGDGEIRVTTANMVDNGKDASPRFTYENISLEGWAAVDTDENNAPREFVGWKAGTATSVATGKPDYTDKIAKIAKGTLDPGNYTLRPTMIAEPISSVTIAQRTINLTNENTPATGQYNKKTVDLGISPYNTGATVDLVPNKTNFYQVWATKVVSPATTVAEIAIAGGKYAVSGAGTTTVSTSQKSRDDVFEVRAITDATTIPSARRAGQVVFDVQSNEKSYGTLTVNIDGFDFEDGVYYEGGEIVKNDSRIVTGNTWFFDEKGAHVTGNKIITKADGKKIAIVGGVLASEGEVTIDGKTYYVGSDGFLLGQGIHKVGGVDRLFREDGSMVRYSDSDVKDGKITVGNVTYKIDPTTNEAKPDKKMVNAKFEWTTSKPSKWELSNPLPTSDWKVTYNLEGESEKLYANGTVTATASPADYKTLVGVTEVTFTFAVPDLSGYYSDAKGTTALTADPAVWKYKFKGSTGLGEGISVEGLSDDDEFDYTGYAITPSFRVVDNETGATLVEKTDYTLKWTNNNPKATALPATATVTITGKGNYDKTAITRTFKIVDPMSGETSTDYSAVKSVKVEKETITYDGTEQFPKTLTITLADKSKVTATWNGSDYDLSPDTAKVKIIVSNNINKGKGNVTVYGSEFKKPAKTTFTIAAADVASLGDKLTVEPEAPVYTKSGAKAKVTVKFNGDELVEGRDYTLNFKYSNRKNAGTAAGSVYITGKNNFKGSTKNTPVSFDIQKLTISDENVIVDAYAGVAPKSIKAKVYDSEGNEIAKSNYTIKVEDKDGNDISTSSTKLVAGDEITVTVAGAAGSNADEETKAEIDITIRTKLSSAKFNAKGLQKEFNGSEVKLDSTDMDKVTATVKINKVDTTLKYGTDYEIVGYKNNTKKGTMTVFVRAKDSSEKVSGFGSFKVKIVPKPVKDADK